MADDPKHSKPTRTFERKELADLTAASKGDAVEELSDSLARGTDRNRAPADAEPAAPSLGRTQTLSDPLTMALLAEVARNSQTMDLDPEKLSEVVPPDEDAAPDVHPHLKRRG